MQEGKAIEDGNDEQLIDSRKREIVRQACEAEFELCNTDIEVDLSQATRLPLAEIASLGVGFASIPEVFRTAVSTVSVSGLEGVYQAVFPNGMAGALERAPLEKGGGYYGFVKGGGASKLATFHPLDELSADVITTVPYDPASMFMALALMEINQKLDAIQETQQEMFEYIRQKDKAELRGNLETLADVLNNYRFNWDNQQYKNNKHILVQGIRNDAEKSIIQHRAQIQSKIGKGKLVHVDRDVREKGEAIRDELEEYRLAVYLYSFSSFLEIMLLENYDSGYLDAIVGKIDNHSLRYRELYTDAFNVIENEADTSVRAMALGGLSAALGAFGKAVEGTPLGDVTLIDEALIDAGKNVDNISKDLRGNVTDKLIGASSSDVRPFVDSIQNINRLYNEPMALVADEDAIYILPSEVG